MLWFCTFLVCFPWLSNADPHQPPGRHDNRTTPESHDVNSRRQATQKPTKTSTSQTANTIPLAVQKDNKSTKPKTSTSTSPNQSPIISEKSSNDSKDKSSSKEYFPILESPTFQTNYEFSMVPQMKLEAPSTDKVPTKDPSDGNPPVLDVPETSSHQEKNSTDAPKPQPESVADEQSQSNVEEEPLNVLEDPDAVLQATTDFPLLFKRMSFDDLMKVHDRMSRLEQILMISDFENVEERFKIFKQIKKISSNLEEIKTEIEEYDPTASGDLQRDRVQQMRLHFFDIVEQVMKNDDHQPGETQLKVLESLRKIRSSFKTLIYEMNVAESPPETSLISPKEKNLDSESPGDAKMGDGKVGDVKMGDGKVFETNKGDAKMGDDKKGETKVTAKPDDKKQVANEPQNELKAIQNREKSFYDYFHPQKQSDEQAGKELKAGNAPQNELKANQDRKWAVLDSIYSKVGADLYKEKVTRASQKESEQNQDRKKAIADFFHPPQKQSEAQKQRQDQLLHDHMRESLAEFQLNQLIGKSAKTGDDKNGEESAKANADSTEVIGDEKDESPEPLRSMSKPAIDDHFKNFAAYLQGADDSQLKAVKALEKERLLQRKGIGEEHHHHHKEGHHHHQQEGFDDDHQHHHFDHHHEGSEEHHQNLQEGSGNIPDHQHHHSHHHGHGDHHGEHHHHGTGNSTDETSAILFPPSNDETPQVNGEFPKTIGAVPQGIGEMLSPNKDNKTSDKTPTDKKYDFGILNGLYNSLLGHPHFKPKKY